MTTFHDSVNAKADAASHAIALGRGFGLSGANLVVVACCASVPSASNAYVPAQILVLQTVGAAFTMPLFIALAG